MIHIFGGGTFFDVRPHLSLAARASGSTAYTLASMFRDTGREPQLHLTRQVTPSSPMVTNADVAARLDFLIADPTTRMIVLSCALVDYEATAEAMSGRLQTSLGDVPLTLTPAAKVINRIREQNKGIYLVGFKAAAGVTSDELYTRGLRVLKTAHCNLVVANDMSTKHGMLIVPEEARYFEGTDRTALLRGTVDTAIERSYARFTRSTVVPGELVGFGDPRIPANLRAVVGHCIEAHAYKPFRGATAGHFGVRIGEDEIITSARRTDFNGLPHGSTQMVRVTFDGPGHVLAHRAKPSVGGRSQKAILDSHPDMDCIVHFHCPLRPDAPDVVNVASQREYECGSHECGDNTARNLRPVGDGDVHVVMLDNHGPNIVFKRTTPPETVIRLIDRNFDLGKKTGGLVHADA